MYIKIDHKTIRLMLLGLGLACALSGCSLASFSISNQHPPPGGCVGEPHRVQC